MRCHVENGFEPIEEISRDDVKKIEVDILRTFVAFCEENHLRYYLAGGTLIGAVRHQGFIPWDDDMDVTMPRPDFERFRELTADGKLGPYEIRSIQHTPEIHCRPFDRIVNPNYMCSIKTAQINLPPWLDVLPWDGLPTENAENKKHWDKVTLYRRLVDRAWLPFSKTKNKFKRAAKYIFYLPLKLIGPIFFAEKIEKLGKKYAFEDCEYVGTFVAGYGRKERMPKYYFIDGDIQKKLWFEGILCSVPAHYDLVLKHMYGDYMVLPPKKKRKIHMTAAWRIIRK